MRIEVANHSGFPAAAGEPAVQLAAALRDQEESGADFVSDGACGGGALVEMLMEPLDGVRPGAAQSAPFFAMPFRRPRVQAKLRHRRPILAARARQAAGLAKRPLKAVLCGPYSAAHLSRIETTAYASAAALAADLSVIIADEVRSLVECGVGLIQIDEPMILARPADFRLLRELLEPLQTAVEARAVLAVSTYGGDAAGVYAQLCSLPGELVCLDCATSPELIDVIASSGAGKPLALGLVDGRRETPESTAACGERLERALRRYEHERIVLQPSCSMEALSIDAARAKIAVLAAARARLCAS